MDKYRIRKLQLNNKHDFNLYIELKKCFLSEIKETNQDYSNIINSIQFESKISAYINKFNSSISFLKSNLDVFVLEEFCNDTIDDEFYKPIAYTSLSKKVSGKNNNWNISPNKTFEIENIFALPEHRLNSKILDLLKYAVKSAYDENKKIAIFNVLSTNSNKYFHFALADFIMTSQPLINYKNFSTIYLYTLCCEDITKILNLSLKELFSKAYKLQNEQTYEYTEIPISLVEGLDFTSEL